MIFIPDIESTSPLHCRRPLKHGSSKVTASFGHGVKRYLTRERGVTAQSFSLYSDISIFGAVRSKRTIFLPKGNEH